MTDRKRLLSHQDLLHQQTQDFLLLGYLQRSGPRLQPATEISEGFDQPEALRWVGCHRFQRLLFSLNRLLLLAEFRHPAPKLSQTHQAFLVGVQQAVHALLQPDLFSV